MLLTPADRGPDAQPEAGRPGPADAWLAAPAADPSVPATAHVGGRARVLADTAVDNGIAGVGLAEASVRAGGCFARSLPLDESCASTARRFFRESVVGAGLPPDLVYDGVTMASELAANTLNAHANVEFGHHGHRPVSGMPEFWVYLRSCTMGRELVCKIFDSEPGWDAGEPLPVGAAVPAGPDSVRGRGLQMVAGLSAGHWGHHLSRGRLGAWRVQGKAVWFALHVPPGTELARSERIAPPGSRAIEELAAALADRGLGAGLVPVTEPGGDLAVLSISQHLTVWCRGEIVWWQEPDGGYDRLLVTDLVEAAERIVCAHEELDAASRAAVPEADRPDAGPPDAGPPDGGVPGGGVPDGRAELGGAG